jgi:4-amino-4-deoxy-L-arabinose transferase-like glycosyltransferase
MFLAAEEAAAAGGHIDVFDFFVLAFTLLIAIGVLRSITAKQKNLFAIGFGVVSLGVFLFMDVIMLKGWF